jgi:hypothetical protein
MKCNEAQDKFADFLADDIDAQARADFDAHLARCASCSAELRSLSETWAKLGVLPQERPSSELRTRFYTMLEAYRKGQEETAPNQRPRFSFDLESLRPRRPILQFGTAIMLMVLGLAAGYFLSRPDRGSAGSVSQLRQEVQDMRQTLASSLLKQDSPFDRLQGVSLSRQIAAPDRSLLQTLLQTLDDDSNVNVRLAAVDALYLFYDQPGVKDHILGSLAKQNSPLIQAALIDLLVGIRERQAVESLRQLLQDKNLNPQVKQKAVQGIQQLSS